MAKMKACQEMALARHVGRNRPYKLVKRKHGDVFKNKRLFVVIKAICFLIYQNMLSSTCLINDLKKEALITKLENCYS